MIRFNALSPVELKIFYDKNKILINKLYIFLCFYTFAYIVLWGIKFYKSKIIANNYMKLR